jgi:hypothetical protein
MFSISSYNSDYIHNTILLGGFNANPSSGSSSSGYTGPTGSPSVVTGYTGPTGNASVVTGPTGSPSVVTGYTGPTGNASVVTGPTGNASVVTGPTGSAGNLQQTLSNGNTATGTTATISLTNSGVGGSTNPALTLVNTDGGATEVLIDLYKNSASPAVNDAIGTVSFNGNSSTLVKREYARIATTIGDSTNTSENGIMSLSACVNSSTPAEFFRCNGLTSFNELYKSLETRGNSIQNTTAGQNLTLSQNQNTQTIVLNSSGVNSAINLYAYSGANSNINLQASGIASINATTGGITLLGGNTNGINTNQPVGGPASLRSGLPALTNQGVYYYPTVHVDNQNGSSISIQNPQMPYQNLTIINKDVSPATVWNDIGTNNYGAIDAMYRSPAGFVWISSGSNIFITDTSSQFTTILQTIALSGTSSGAGSTRALCFAEAGGYVWIGGDFTSVNGNATQQYGLTRILTSGTVGSWTEDPIYDSVNNAFGVNGYVNTLTLFGSYLWAGGNFTTINGSGTPAGYAMRIQNQSNSGGGQTYDNDGGNMQFNNEVFCSCASASFIFFGGAFTTIQSGLNPYQYFVAYTGTNFQTCDNNNFNSNVNACAVSVLGNQILVGGSFSQGGFQNICYIDASSPITSTNAGVASPNAIQKNGINTFNAGGRDMFSDGQSNTYTSSTFTTWNSLDQALGSNTPSGCFFETTPYVSFSAQGLVRQNTAVSQTASFSLPSTNFRTPSGLFQTATLPAMTAQQFVSDSVGNYWYAVGQPIATFS